MRLKRKIAVSIATVALLIGTRTFGNGSYSFTISMWDVGTVAVSGEANGPYYNGGGYIDAPPIALGQDISDPGILSITLSPTSSNWLDIMNAPVLDGSGDVEADAGTETPNGGKSDGGGAAVFWYSGADGSDGTATTTTTNYPYLTYTVTSGVDTTVWCQLWTGVTADGTSATGPSTITMSNFAVGIFFYNENISVLNWFGSDPSDYFNTTNWSAGTVPSGVDAVATLGYQDAARTLPQPATTVTLSSNLTLGTLIFDNPNSYMINGPGSLTMQASSADAEVFVNQGSHTINAPVTLATTTDFYISSGSLNITSPVTAASGAGLNEFGSGTLILGGITADSLAIYGTKLIISVDSPPSEVQSLSIAPGATLDLNSNMVVDYSSDSPLTSIQTMLKAGYDGGAWDGISMTSGVIVSSSATSKLGTTIGYADGSTDIGTTAAPGTVLIMYTWLGDLNLNGVVDSNDLSTMTADSGMSNADWAEGDMNYDGMVNGDDFSLLMLCPIHKPHLFSLRRSWHSAAP